MAKTEVILAILVSLVLLVNVFVLTGIANKPAPEAKIVEVEKQVLVQVPVESNVTVDSEIIAIKDKVYENENWEAEAIKLAEAEWNTNKKVFNALVDLGLSISDREDISSVRIMDSDVSDIDVDDKDAEVTQEVRVYYENTSGDDLRANLIVTVVIDDNEAQEATIVLA